MGRGRDLCVSLLHCLPVRSGTMVLSVIDFAKSGDLLQTTPAAQDFGENKQFRLMVHVRAASNASRVMESTESSTVIVGKEPSLIGHLVHVRVEAAAAKTKDERPAVSVATHGAAVAGQMNESGTVADSAAPATGPADNACKNAFQHVYFTELLVHHVHDVTHVDDFANKALGTKEAEPNAIITGYQQAIFQSGRSVYWCLNTPDLPR
ncbi:hypothetical protein GWI33_009956 [Rhynchophorus ferrugineus]|uniref:Uncharacterized protein n=1 Tax=Rhynchophorus ferrugineus TaxID=354439 RepID=A0A834ITG6_RHYFE|nr:hypothetical protein GWI33_009956 [Rhynchophorus ferrugineus]